MHKLLHMILPLDDWKLFRLVQNPMRQTFQPLLGFHQYCSSLLPPACWWACWLRRPSTYIQNHHWSAPLRASWSFLSMAMIACSSKITMAFRQVLLCSSNSRPAAVQINYVNWQWIHLVKRKSGVTAKQLSWHMFNQNSEHSKNDPNKIQWSACILGSP